MTPTPKKRQQRSPLLPNTSGTVGTYLVAAELVRRGFIVSALSQTAKGIDILAADPQTLRPLAIQVKTSQSKVRSWMLLKHHEQVAAEGLYYVFVTLPPDGAPSEFFVVPSGVVAEAITTGHVDWLKTPGKKGQPHRDTDMRMFWDLEGHWLNRWDALKGT